MIYRPQFEQFEHIQFDPNIIRQNAMRFDTSIFVKEIQTLIENILINDRQCSFRTLPSRVGISIKTSFIIQLNITTKDRMIIRSAPQRLSLPQFTPHQYHIAFHRQRLIGFDP